MHAGHELAREQIAEIVEASGGLIDLHRADLSESGETLIFKLALPFQPIERTPGGLPVRARERFRILVGPGFPFTAPGVYTTHHRFAGFSHVQWINHICLYQSEADWQPAAGMYGLIRRLDSWIRDAARDQLDPADAPLHPPVAYPTSDRLIIPTRDTPRVMDEAWIGFAALRERGKRTEIVDWVELGEELPEQFAAALLLPKAFPFEYPTKVGELLDELEKKGFPYVRFMFLLSLLARLTRNGTPLLVVLGAPMRRVQKGGPPLQHLEVWEIDAESADALRVFRDYFSDDPNRQELGEEARDKVVQWSVCAKVLWCNVREQREEVTIRRDQRTPVSWFRARTVELWGCGAIGSHVAESLVRAGVSRLVLRDRGKVMPGLLVRQAFDDDDVGDWKAIALSARVARLNPDLHVDAHIGDLLSLLDEQDPFGDADLVIDTTGSAAVRLKFERRLRNLGSRPRIASMAVSFDAQAGIATLSRPEHCGGIADVSRRLKLAACLDGALGEYRDDFWPDPPRLSRFQPEPGCSEPTFVGSNADLAAFSARMLNALGDELRFEEPEETCAGWFLGASGSLRRFVWLNDVVVGGVDQRYEVRLSSAAVREMRAWTRRSNRIHGPWVETGGLLFGELNEAAAVLWVTEAEGPPPDSDASTEHFKCGVAGMAEANSEKRDRTRGSVACVGSWHTHPESPARPSDVDLQGVMDILADADTARRTCLLLILGTDPDGLVSVGAYVYRTTSRSTNTVIGQRVTSGEGIIQPPSTGPRNIGLALSGGGSRAMAFHLGCLRALNDLNLLSRVQVISGVSGGSVIGALYAYHDEPFAEFETRVVAHLERGFVRDTLGSLLRSASLVPTILTWAAAPALDLLRTLSARLPRPLLRAVPWLDVRSKPPRRRHSRTEAFRATLNCSFLGKRMADVERRHLDVVLTATELRSGSAFRFGSRETGCWRYVGYSTIPKDEALVADAVAASAAYPVLLPALERDYTFTGLEKTTTERVVLTDGGVFDNLGVSAFYPERRESISTNVFRPEYILSCDAGTGLFEMDAFPMSWVTRIKRSFLTTHRKAQDATRARLHKLTEEGAIKGFVLSYLGQRDSRLPWVPADLPARATVVTYPTDFSPMTDDDLNRLSLRGERLTRLLVAQYWPEV